MIFAVGFNKIKIKPSNDAQWTNVSYVEGFAELFKADYEYYTDYFTSYEAYINNAYIWSNKTQELKQSISDAFDFTIIKPIIEICIGEDLIMNTKLTDEQKVLKALGIFMDAGMFMFSLVSGGESITAGVVIKSLLVEMVTGMSMVGATYYANVADLSFGQTMLLMMIVGTFTGLTANQAFDFVEDGVDNLIYNLKNSDCWDDIDFILNGDGSYHLKYDPRAEYDNYLSNKKVKELLGDVGDYKTSNKIFVDGAEVVENVELDPRITMDVADSKDPRLINKIKEPANKKSREKWEEIKKFTIAKKGYNEKSRKM